MTEISCSSTCLIAEGRRANKKNIRQEEKKEGRGDHKATRSLKAQKREDGRRTISGKYTHEKERRRRDEENKRRRGEEKKSRREEKKKIRREEGKKGRR